MTVIKPEIYSQYNLSKDIFSKQARTLESNNYFSLLYIILQAW